MLRLLVAVHTRRLRACQDGAGAVEYAVLVGLIGAVIVGAVGAFGGEVRHVFRVAVVALHRAVHS